MKNNPVDFLIKRPLEGITEDDVKEIQKEYWEWLNKNKFPLPASGNAIEIIHYAKRKTSDKKTKEPQSIGPWENITVFEAANRIASDLVILKGVINLLRKHAARFENAKITLRLGNKHKVGKGDFTMTVAGKDYEGEAFNVAPSFFENKLRKTLNNCDSRKIKFILFNSELEEDSACKSILEKKKMEYREIEMLGVENWDTPL